MTTVELSNAIEETICFHTATEDSRIKNNGVLIDLYKSDISQCI